MKRDYEQHNRRAREDRLRGKAAEVEAERLLLDLADDGVGGVLGDYVAVVQHVKLLRRVATRVQQDG